jgi:uncharacterized protein (DUF111 family)
MARSTCIRTRTITSPGITTTGLPEIRARIDGSALSRSGKTRAKALFQRLAEAEARIHQMPVEQVHLHEVGELDSIIDIVGPVFAMEWVAPTGVVCSPLNVGRRNGDVGTRHLSVPAPATLALLGDAPIYSGSIQKELVTPTGALIATGYAESFGPIPPMSIEKIGYGAGMRDNAGTPNVLRILIGQSRNGPARRAGRRHRMRDRRHESAAVRDGDGAAICGRGARGVLCRGPDEEEPPGHAADRRGRPDQRAVLADIIFRETTTIGVRHYEVERECLEREIIAVDTSLGQVRFKLAWRDGRVINATPEFEDLPPSRATHNISVKDVQALAHQAYGARATAPPTAL